MVSFPKVICVDTRGCPYGDPSAVLSYSTDSAQKARQAVAGACTCVGGLVTDTTHTLFFFKSSVCFYATSSAFYYLNHLDHQPPVPFDLLNLLKWTEKITDWKNLGLYLKVPAEKLETIEQNRGDVKHCKYEVLNYWINNEPTASWETLADTIESMGEYKVLVRDIRNNCCKQGTYC